MAAASTMILQALKRVSAIDIHSAAASNEENAYALEVLNTMLDSWNIQRLSIYHIVQRVTTWPISTSTRTIGTGGNYTFARPDNIESAYVTVDGDEYPVQVLRQREQYDQIIDKGASAKIPDAIFYDNAYPNATLYMYGVPDAALTLLLNVWEPLQSFASVSTVLSMPPGYQRAIEWSLAEELLANYPQNDPTVERNIVKQASNARRAIKNLNAPDSGMTTEVGHMTTRNHGSILTGI